MGSGMSVQDMRGNADPRFGPVSDAFDRWLVETGESLAPQHELAA